VDLPNETSLGISDISERRISNSARKLCARLAAELKFCTMEEMFDTGLHDLGHVQLKLNNVGGAMNLPKMPSRGGNAVQNF
jgi:hypothetical protein